ncbi:MAG: cysteine desulfurase family protein [Anaerolineaceae bacterium]
MYFDYCATTPISTEVLEAMHPFWQENFGNPSSLHQHGQIAAKALQHAREQVAGLLGADEGEIIFTSGATEADNLALMGILRPWENKIVHLITSSVEHHAVLHTAQALEKMGCLVTYLPVDSTGMIDLDDLRRAIRKETCLISIMHVNNEVGTMQPIAEIGKIAKENGILFHCDAVQGVGLLEVNVKEMGMQLLSLSAHKIYGPKGVGALYLKKDIEIQNLFYGGSQEKKIRPGTENVPGIVGFGKAAELIQKDRVSNKQHAEVLRDQLIHALKVNIPDLVVNGPADDRVCPHVISLTFPGSVAEMMQIRLAMQGVAVSLGSACNAKEIAPSHVLLAIGLSRESADATIRVSLGAPTTADEVTLLSQLLPVTASACKI